MPATVMFSAREQRRHLAHSCLGVVVGVVGRSEPVGRVPGPHSTSLVTLLPPPIKNLGALSGDVMGTKRKPCIWSNTPTRQMGKLRLPEGKGCAHQHHPGWPQSCFQSIPERVSSRSETSKYVVPQGDLI